MTEQLRAREGGRRRKMDELYPGNGEANEGLVGRRCSHPLVPMKRPRTTRRLSTSSSSSSSSSAAAVKPEPEEVALPAASSSSPAPASSSSSYDSKTVELDDIYVGVRDQVVYWGNSKNKYDVTVCVRAPTRFSALLKGATISYQVSLPAVQEFKMKSRANAKGKGKPKPERDVKKAVLQLVRTESDNGVVELEAFLKNCLPTEKLSNLTLLELHFSITPKLAAGRSSQHNIKPPSRGGRKRAEDDDDYEIDEEEEDGLGSLNDDEDEYMPARGGRGRGARGKTGHRARGKAGHSHHGHHQQREEERESEDGQGMEYSGMQHSMGGGDIPQMQMTPYAEGGVAPIERKVPVVTYTHSKAITRALCRLIWYPMNEENTMSTDFLLEKLCKYFASQLQLPISIYDRHNLAAMLSPFTDGITYVEFYSLLGEWFVLAIKMAKKKTQCLWQQGRETFIPLLFNPYRRLTESSSSSSSSSPSSSSSSSSSTSVGAGDDDEWTEDNEESASSSSSRRNGRGRGRRSRSGSRAGLHQSAAAAAAAAVSGKGKEPEAADVSAQLQLDGILEREGDFLVTIGPDLKERHGRAEGEEGRGVNYFPSLKYPLQIVYVKEGGGGVEKQCLSVENKLDKLTDFIHAKRCLRDCLVLQRDGTWKRVEKDKFAFNHAQQRRLEETQGRTSVLAREDADSLSYAHA